MQEVQGGEAVLVRRQGFHRPDFDRVSQAASNVLGRRKSEGTVEARELEQSGELDRLQLTQELMLNGPRQMTLTGDEGRHQVDGLIEGLVETYLDTQIETARSKPTEPKKRTVEVENLQADGRRSVEHRELPATTSVQDPSNPLKPMERGDHQAQPHHREQEVRKQGFVLNPETGRPIIVDGELKKDEQLDARRSRVGTDGHAVLQ